MDNVEMTLKLYQYERCLKSQGASPTPNPKHSWIYTAVGQGDYKDTGLYPILAIQLTVVFCTC